jgi:hypothetical protein
VSGVESKDDQGIKHARVERYCPFHHGETVTPGMPPLSTTLTWENTLRERRFTLSKYSATSPTALLAHLGRDERPITVAIRSCIVTSTGSRFTRLGDGGGGWGVSG